MPAVTRILIVDDDPALLQALPETLRLRIDGAVVDTVDSAAAALERIKAVDYDAVVTDIKMPGMDGLALLNEIRSLRPETPTLLITGHGEHDLAVKALRGGAYDFIAKPIERDYFAASLNRAIRTRHLKRELDAQKAELEEHAKQLERAVQMYEREHSIAETLQRSLLPRRLPDIPGITAAARYLPATPEAVGGDWYDMFSLPGGRVGVVMGDVAGRGIQVASLMGQLRNALRAYAGEGYPPSVVLSRLATIIEPTEMATLLFMVFDPSSWKIEYANAGHPPPLVATPDGHAAFLEGGSIPLGPALNQTYRDFTADLVPGSLLMLYTDGLVEDRATDLNESLHRLRDAVVRSGNDDVEHLADRLVKEIRSTSASSDDTALLILRIAELDPSKIELTMPSIPASLPAIRHALRRWMADAGVEADDAYEVLVASCEACSNVIEHAYGLANGDVEVYATIVQDVIEVTVRDRGTWTPPRGVHRGRGLHMIRALVEDMEVRQTDQGTIVRMRYRRRGSRNDVDRADQGDGSQRSAGSVAGGGN
jgi:serine phosphatase RsbU (regulator of sigma subunit)/anti-sigma regulatory factor (Ser/Thr protein kinase)